MSALLSDGLQSQIVSFSMFHQRKPHRNKDYLLKNYYICTMNAKKNVAIIFLTGFLAVELGCPLYSAPVSETPSQGSPELLIGDTLSHSGVTNLQDVVVTAVPEQSLIPGQQLAGKELERLSAFNVADAVRYFSGAQIKDYGGVGGVKTVDVRSMGSNHLGVFYDGVALGNAQNGQIDLGRYSLDNVEQISLYNGQKSELFSTAKDLSSAGALYIRTRRPLFVEGKRLNLHIGMRGGSFGLLNPSLRLEYRFNPDLSGSLSAEYTHADGRYRFRYRRVYPDGSVAWDTTAVRQNGDVEALRIESALFGRITEGSYMIKGYFYNSERGIPGAIVNNVWKNAQRQWDRNLFLQGNLRRSLSEHDEIMINAKFAHDYLHYLNPDTTLMYTDNEFHQTEVYASVANMVNVLPDWNVNVALDYQFNTLSSTLEGFADPTRHTLMAALSSNYSLGGLSAQGSLMTTSVFDRSWSPRKGDAPRTLYRRSRTALTAGLFLNWQPLPGCSGLRIRGFYKRAFRMPTFNDLYYTDMGNAKLEPEYATQYDLGLSQRWEFTSTIWRYLDLKLDGYHNLITDKIIAVPKGNSQYRWMMMNIGKVRIWGLDFNAEAMIVPLSGFEIGGKLAYTWQRALDYTDPADCLDAAGTYKGQIAYIPENSGAFTAFMNWKSWELNYSFIYVGERWHNSSNIPENYEQPWYTHDMTLAYTLPIGGSSVRFIGELNNIFNQQYEVILNYPMPGRNWRLGISWDF